MLGNIIEFWMKNNKNVWTFLGWVGDFHKSGHISLKLTLDHISWVSNLLFSTILNFTYPKTQLPPLPCRKRIPSSQLRSLYVDTSFVGMLSQPVFKKKSKCTKITHENIQIYFQSVEFVLPLPWWHDN